MSNISLLSDAELRSRLAGVQVLAMDVDGVLTDGGIQFDSSGADAKRFHVSDGLGLVALRPLGILVVWISGRRSPVVARRAAELDIHLLMEGVRDKGRALRDFADQTGIPSNTIAYIGDDWNDLTAFNVAGVKIAVANAATAVKNAADLVTAKLGGAGAVREVCETLMEARNARDTCLRAYLELLTHEDGTSTVTQ